MSISDLGNNLGVSKSLSSTAINSNTTTNGDIIDAQGLVGLMFIARSGAYTDGTYTINIQGGDASNLSDAVSIAAADLTHDPASNTITAANTVKRFGVQQLNYRYYRMQIVSTSVTTGATLLGEVVTKSELRPVA